VAATLTVRLQVPVLMKLTVAPTTVQIAGVVEVTVNTVPLPEVEKVGVKLPPLFIEAGMFVIDTVGVARPMLKLCAGPVAAE
jgi:hypothetical protein